MNPLVNKERPAPDTACPIALLYTDSKVKAFHGNHVYLALAAFQCGQDDSARSGVKTAWLPQALFGTGCCILKF